MDPFLSPQPTFLDIPENSNGLQPNSKKIQKKKSYSSAKKKHSSDSDQMNIDETSYAQLSLAEDQNQLGYGGKKGVGVRFPDDIKEDIICKVIKKVYGKPFTDAGNEKIIKLLKEPRLTKDDPICKDFVLSDLKKADSRFNNAIKEVISDYDQDFEATVDALRDRRRTIRRWIKNLGKIDGRGQPRIPKDKRENFRLFIISILMKQPLISKKDLLDEIAKIAKHFCKDADENKMCKDHWWQLCIDKDPIIKEVWTAACKIKRMKMNVDNLLISDALYQSSRKLLMSNNDEKSLEQLSGNLSSDFSNVGRNLDVIGSETLSTPFNVEGEKVCQEEEKLPDSEDSFTKFFDFTARSRNPASSEDSPIHFNFGSPTSNSLPYSQQFPSIISFK